MFVYFWGKAPAVNYFGRRVKVFFDDNKWYTGVIVGPNLQMWVTKFKDGTEQSTEDPSTDKDYKLLN